MLSNPFAKPGQFYRGNLHGHSTNSDGKFVVAEVVEKYRAHGYDFIAISDHFMEVYGYPVTDSRAHRDEDFTTLLAAELHLSKMENGELWHVLAVGLPADFTPPVEHEDIVDLASRAADAGAFIGMVHPSWNGMTPTDAARLPFAHAVEVYNHSSEVEIARGNGWGLCDQLLNQGRRVSAFAVDDSHYFDNDFEGGWVHVKAQNLEPEALLESLKNGWYYSSQGPLIHDISVSDDEICITCSPARNIILSGHGSKGENIDGIGMTSACFPAHRFRDAYARVTVTDAHGRHAWSNPIWFDPE
jgi:hypothetical protein